jgi:hypothetical protein
MTAHPGPTDPLQYIDLTVEIQAAELAGLDLHGFLAESIDLLLESGLPAALVMAADRISDLALEPSWGAVSNVAHIKSAMQTTR